MASRKLYMRKWRKANPSYNKGNLIQRYCKECNVEVGKGKTYCSECYTIRRRAKARASYKYTPEKAAIMKKWREDNPERCKELYQKARQRKLDKLASLIFNVDRNSSELIFVNHLLEEIINGKEIVRPELEKCNRIYKQYKELKRNGFTANNS